MERMQEFSFDKARQIVVVIVVFRGIQKIVWDGGYRRGMLK